MRNARPDAEALRTVGLLPAAAPRPVPSKAAVITLALGLASAAAVAALAGCNTTSGIGQDIEAAGDAIDDAASDAAD